MWGVGIDAIGAGNLSHHIFRQHCFKHQTILNFRCICRRKLTKICFSEKKMNSIFDCLGVVTNFAQEYACDEEEKFLNKARIRLTSS